MNLPDIYLTPDEVRALVSERLGGLGYCLICGERPSPPTYRLEGAHVAGKGMGGRKHDGPQVELCYSCHQAEGYDGKGSPHTHPGSNALAVRRDDLSVVLVRQTGPYTFTEKPLGVTARRGT